MHTKLLFLIKFSQYYVCLHWLSGSLVGVGGSDLIGYVHSSVQAPTSAPPVRSAARGQEEPPAPPMGAAARGAAVRGQEEPPAPPGGAMARGQEEPPAPPMGTLAWGQEGPPVSPRGAAAQGQEELRGNHLSDTTCPTQVLFKSVESCSELW